MACEDQINTEDLINAKSDATTLGEVATSRAGAVEGGTPITTSTNRFGEVTDTIQGRLSKLGVLFDDPIRDWSASLLVSDLRAHRYPATTGDIYIPTKPLPFTTGGTFNTDDWEVLQGVTRAEIIVDLSLTYTFNTSVLMASSSELFPINKRLATDGGASVGDGLNAIYTVSSSQLNSDYDVQLSDGKWANWQKLATNQTSLTVYHDAPNNAQIQSVIDGADKTGLIKIIGNSAYDQDVNWKGFEHESSDLPFLLNSQPITGGNLNARMTVANGYLYVCSYLNATIQAFSLTDPRQPVLSNEWAVSAQPRHIEIVGRYAIVACHAADRIEVWDISNPTFTGLVGTILTGTKPKMFEITGNELYVVCAGTSNLLEKYTFQLPSEDFDFSYKREGGVPVGEHPLCCAINKEGFVAVCGLETNEIHLIASSNLSVLNVYNVGQPGHGTCVWANKTQLLVSDSAEAKVHSISYETYNAPSLSASVSVGFKPEQIEIIGNKFYVPSLVTASTLSAVDITDAKNPYFYKSIDLNVAGAGFTAYYRQGNTGYLYVNGHFAPYNIEVVEVITGESKSEEKDVHENLQARNAGISKLDVGLNSVFWNYETTLNPLTTTSKTNVLRIGQGATITLHDPATNKGKQMIITNISGAIPFDIVSSFAGFSGTLEGNASVTLVSMDYQGAFQWDAISSHGTIT